MLLLIIIGTFTYSKVAITTLFIFTVPNFSMSIRNFFKSMIFRVNIIVVIVFLCTYLAPYISPQTWWIPAPMGLAYPFLLIINVCFMFFWLYRRSRYALLSLVVMALGWILLHNSFAFRLTSWTSNVPKADSLLVKVMSYNVKNFDLYNWTKNSESRDKMMELIRQEKPDIICFQEFYSQDDTLFDNVKYISEQLKYPYYQFEKTLTLRKTNHWGIAVFSQYPFSNSRRIEFGNSEQNIAMSVDAVIHNDTVRLYNTHLQSTHLGNRDIKYVENIGDNIETKNTSEHLKSLGNIAEKLRGAYIKRGVQANKLATDLARSPYKNILCGDFNDTPVSYTYRTLSKNLQDSYLRDGIGFGGTYSLGPLPAFRIDYVLIDTSFMVHNFDIIDSDKNRSDHYPIISTFEF